MEFIYAEWTMNGVLFTQPSFLYFITFIVIISSNYIMSPNHPHLIYISYTPLYKCHFPYIANDHLLLLNGHFIWVGIYRARSLLFHVG